MVAVTLNISPEAERLLKAEWGDLGQAAQEALVIESYRRGKLSIGQCSEILGASLAETEMFLRTHGVDLGLTAEDVQRDYDRLKGIVK
jgi:predicted HTH domain antitoxin